MKIDLKPDGYLYFLIAGSTSGRSVGEKLVTNQLLYRCSGLSAVSSSRSPLCSGSHFRLIV